jgi:polysaccharide biosynthesis/export protein
LQFDLSRRQLLFGSGIFLLAGCAVPRGAPSRRELLQSGTEDIDFALEIVAQERLPTYAAWDALKAGPNLDWPAGSGAPGDQRLASGDQISLRIWDAEESSLITSPGAQFADITNVVVSGAGFVTLPYVGEVAVRGLTPDAARETLQEKLTEIVRFPCWAAWPIPALTR